MSNAYHSSLTKAIAIALIGVLVLGFIATMAALWTAGEAQARKSSGAVTLNFNCDDEKPGKCVCKGDRTSSDCKGMMKNCINECPGQGDCTLLSCDADGCECDYRSRWWQPKRKLNDSRPEGETAPRKSE